MTSRRIIRRQYDVEVLDEKCWKGIREERYEDYVW